jgi:hypothetical protein
VNGAEYLELDAEAQAAHVSLPTLVKTKCGIDLWRLDAAKDRPFTPAKDRPVVSALERRSIPLPFTSTAHAVVAAAAQEAGLRVAQYIRTRCGFEVRETSLPGSDERGHEEDDAWERLKRLGLDPEKYFGSGGDK